MKFLEHGILGDRDCPFCREDPLPLRRVLAGLLAAVLAAAGLALAVPGGRWAFGLISLAGALGLVASTATAREDHRRLRELRADRDRPAAQEDRTP